MYCSTELDTSKRTFTLPCVLSLHCANFVTSHNHSVDRNGCGILPSDYLNVRREVEGWNCYPCSYSFLVGRVVSGLCMMEVSDVIRWILVNSPRYGVVIDVAMRDHVFVLLRLCLKAISVEACRSRREVVKEGEGVSEKGLWRFNCPVLGEAMSWLESQLSVLYRETNGMLFSVNMLKFCILNAAKSMSSFFLGKEKTQGDASEEVLRKLDGAVSEMGPEVPTDTKTGKVKIEIPSDDCATRNSLSASSIGGLVFVSQVAAAIAALHERWLLEEKINGLRLAGSLSKSRRLTECTYVTARAEEERKKRSNYRPILEHDGLLWYRSHNQDSNKNKTKEEILAEERDYKRRRMSYRGKKVKRSLTEVARDIINEHMEEIKEAGGIGCFVKGSAEIEAFPPGSVDDVKVDRDFKINSYDKHEPIGGKSHGYSKQSQDQQRRSSHEHYEHLEGQNRSNRKEKRDREYGSKSPDNYGRSHDKSKHRRDLDGTEMTRSKYDKRDSVSLNKTNYRGSRSFSFSSNSSIDLRDRRHGQNLESEDHYRERRSKNSRSESLRETIFEDRYDPSESDSRYEDAINDESLCNNYVKHEKPYRLNNDSSKSKG